MLTAFRGLPWVLLVFSNFFFLSSGNRVSFLHVIWNTAALNFWGRQIHFIHTFFDVKKSSYQCSLKIRMFNTHSCWVSFLYKEQLLNFKWFLTDSSLSVLYTCGLDFIFCHFKLAEFNLYILTFSRYRCITEDTEYIQINFHLSDCFLFYVGMSILFTPLCLRYLWRLFELWYHLWISYIRKIFFFLADDEYWRGEKFELYG